MVVPLLLASWCLWKADEPVISPGTWQPLHSADGEVQAQADPAQQASPAAPPARSVSRLVVGPHVLDLVFLLCVNGGLH